MGRVADIHLDDAPGERRDPSPPLNDPQVPIPEPNGLAELKDRKMSLFDDIEPIVPPTQFSFFTSQLDSVIHATTIQSLRSFYKPFDTLLDTRESSGLWWLDATLPSDDDIETLSDIFDLHPLTTEDIKVREAREKIELFGRYYFVSLQPPRQVEATDGTRYSSPNVYAIVFREGILTFNFGNSPHGSHVRNRIKEHRSHLALTSDWICYALIDDIVDGFAPFINRVQTGVEMIEDDVSITRPDDIGLALQRIYRYRKEVLQIRQLMHDKTDVIRTFARHCGSFGPATADVTLYLSDIRDHVLSMMGSLVHAEQMLSRAQEKYLSQLSFDSTRMRNEIAATLSRLTVIAGIIVPMQFITGLFGMNVTVPGQTPDDEKSGPVTWWLGIFGVILGLIFIGLVAAKRLRFI
ncbi:magnesium and cobalt transport protein CorA [Aspergillus hancockii]|nr:magnesium and cobalt transport protein CorA [Aspergillus hancockii]